MEHTEKEGERESKGERERAAVSLGGSKERGRTKNKERKKKEIERSPEAFTYGGPCLASHDESAKATTIPLPVEVIV